MTRVSNSTSFPGLANLMNSWLNQDYDLAGDSDEERLRNYAGTGQRELVEAVIVEIDRFLALPTAGLLARYRAETGEWNMLIGNTDEDARSWLQQAKQTFKRVLEE